MNTVLMLDISLMGHLSKKKIIERTFLNVQYQLIPWGRLCLEDLAHEREIRRTVTLFW